MLPRCRPRRTRRRDRPQSPAESCPGQTRLPWELLTPDEFDNRFSTFNGAGNCRQRAQHLRNQRSIVRIADADPQDYRAIVAGCSKQREILVLGHEDGAARTGFLPNLPIRRGEQPQIENMHRIEAGRAQGPRERGRKLSVDKEQQSLFRGNNRMVRLPSCERERSIDICAFEIRIVEKDCLSRLAIRQQAENVRNSDAQATNAWAAMHDVGINRDSRQKL